MGREGGGGARAWTWALSGVVVVVGKISKLIFKTILEDIHHFSY
jgi:hypothetical protein